VSAPTIPSTDPSARERLIERHMPLARSLAHRYRHAVEPLADLEQVAYLALVKAVDRFDPDRGTSFTSYAVPFIVGAIKRHFRDCAWPVHVPRSAKDLGAELEQRMEQAWETTGRFPTAGELADDVGTSVENVLDALQAWEARFSDTLDKPLRDDEPDGPRPIDRLAADDPGFAAALERQVTDDALELLDDRRRLAVELYFRADMRQAEIAELFGCSQMHVSRLIRQGLERLRAALETDRVPRA
jgi:RNA polymerase sigma-B factor